MRLWGLKIAQVLIVALTVVSALEMGLILALRENSGLYDASNPFPAPSGYLLNNRFWKAPPAPCYLLRVTADGCPYSVLDRRQYGRLIQRAKDSGCQIAVVPPRVGDVESKDDPGVIQLQYVDMQFGRALYPLLTPQTILLDGSGHLQWHREGSLDDESLRLALRALGRLRKERSYAKLFDVK